MYVYVAFPQSSSLMSLNLNIYIIRIHACMSIDPAACAKLGIYICVYIIIYIMRVCLCLCVYAENKKGVWEGVWTTALYILKRFLSFVIVIICYYLYDCVPYII